MDNQLMANENRTDRPWGAFFILEDSEISKVKLLRVNPGQRLSLQSHKLRDEHWVVIKGTARVTLDEETRDYSYGQHIYIKRGTRHRLSCPEGTQAVEIIEVQTGDSFAEEDIVRYSDDYGRVE